MSFTARLAASTDIFLVSATRHNRPVWCYLKVDRHRQPHLLQAVKDEASFTPAAYGTVLFEGPGSEPPRHYQNKIAANESTD